MMMKLKNRILGILLLFILLPLSIFGGFSIYQTNRKIDDMTECNLATVSENQRINIKNFCEDRKSEMEMIANYAMTQAAIKESVGEPSPYDAGKVDLEYINNVLKERKKYGVFVASISILDKDFRVVASSESYEAGDTKQKKSLSHFVTDSSERNSFQKAWDEVDHNSNPVGKIYYKYRGDSYVTYYSDVDNTNWGMRLTENLSAQRQTGRSYTVMLCLAFVFFVLAIFIVQIFITKNVLAPIEQIMNVFKDIKATQDYSKRLPKSNSVEMNQLSDEINGLLTHIEDENIQEKERQRHLRELAECDPLTGINNKKAIEQKMLAMVQSATDKKVRISVGFLDIDDFKDYNTNYGHQEGDRCLVSIANTIRNLVEEAEGFCARYGGDEFVIIYANVTREQAVSFAEELRRRVLALEMEHRFSKALPVVTISQGICWGIPRNGNRSWDFLHAADNMLYRVKKFSRNNYCVGGLDETEDVTMGTAL